MFMHLDLFILNNLR